MAEAIDSPPPPPATDDPKPDDSPSNPNEQPPPTTTTTTTTTTPPLSSSFSSLSLSIWPPSQRTRTAVLNRLVETLSSPSVLSNRYGSLPSDEASAVARQIEDDAFALASATPSPSPDDDGMAILQIYSREISKRMLDAVKSRSSASSAAPSSPAPSADADAPVVAPSEEVSSVGSASSQA